MKLALTCLLALVLVAGAACTKTIETPPATEPPAAAQGDETPLTSSPTPTPEATDEAPPPDAITEEDIEAARQAVFAYREAFNNYDVEGTLAFLTESCRTEKEEGIRSDISDMESYGIHLAVEEEAEPTVTDDGKVVIYIKIDVLFPGQADRHVAYQVIEVEGEWKICDYEDVE